MFDDNEVSKLVQTAMDVVLALGLVLVACAIGYGTLSLIWSLK